jgi:hypothetical protein
VLEFGAPSAARQDRSGCDQAVAAFGLVGALEHFDQLNFVQVGFVFF